MAIANEFLLGNKSLKQVAADFKAGFGGGIMRMDK
jgi:hypothetical protein